MISLQPDPAIDNFIFYLRFLDSFVHTWWVAQVIFPEKKLGEVRAQLILKDRQIQQMEYELKAKRRQLLAAAQALARTTATLSNTES